MTKTAYLLYECGANWDYATRVHASDPVLWYKDSKGETHIPVPDLDMAKYMHAKENEGAAATHLHLFSRVHERLSAAGKTPNLAEIALFFIQADAPDVVMVPTDFPLSLADKLRAVGVNLRTPEDTYAPFFPERYVKTLSEIHHLAESQRVNEQALHHGVSILRAADIANDNTLVYQGTPLTAAFLQAEINKKALEGGAQAFSGGPIIGCGIQGAMPHERGHGVLRAHELIVIDTFPRHRNGYWGDLTRTFLKGTPSDWQRRLYDLVLQAQELGLSQLKAGAHGREINQSIVTFFAQHGFPRISDTNGNPCGYIHSLGHSVGLGLHDPGAGLSRLGQPLVAGSVLTVEPGLYYPSDVNGGIGGVRIEDMVAITDTGYTNLTSFPKDEWVIT